MKYPTKISKLYLLKLSIPIFFANLAIPFVGIIDKELNILISLIKTFNPNLIISVGGGATLDLSKIANVLILFVEMFAQCHFQICRIFADFAKID